MPRYMVNIGEYEYDVEVEYRANRVAVKINGREQDVEQFQLGESRSLLIVNGETQEVDVRGNGFSAICRVAGGRSLP